MEQKGKTIERVVELIESTGARAYVDGKRCEKEYRKKAKVFTTTRDLDLLIVMGGDGTILRTVREMENLSVPILSINKGTFGFLAEMSLSESETLLPKFIRGEEGSIEERSLLEVTVMRGSKNIHKSRALNEAVVSQGAISRLIDLETRVNGDSLATFHADGIIVATPTGSTAYSLAAGGPIVHPELHATILTAINPHSFSQKPIVLPSGDEVEITILTKPSRFGDVQVSLTIDGQTYLTLDSRDRVIVKAYPEKVRFLRRKEETFFGTLRNKLKWGERLEERS
jgi:NAD+ kinase